MSLREELASFLRSLDVALPVDLDEDTPLISSGLCDSLALFNLTLWIESKLGAPVDPSSLDIGRTWDSMRLIVEFVENRQSQGLRTPSAVVARTHATSNLRIETFTGAHAHEAAELQTGLWSPDPELNLRYLRWKYEENPYASEPRIYLAYIGARLVAMRGFYASRWQIRRAGLLEDVHVADDLIVRASHRNQGIVTVLMEAALEDLRKRGAEYVFNLSGGRLTVLGSLAMGWRSVGEVAPLGRMSALHGLLAALRNRMSGWSILWRCQFSPHLYSELELRPFARLDRRSGVRATRTGLDIVISSDPRPKDMAMLIDRLGYDGRIRHDRNESYLAWRFRNPLHEYRFLYISANRLRGYVVLKWTRSTFGANARVQIVDWEAEDERCQADLLDAALSAGGFPEVVTWSATLTDSKTGLLLRNGFRPMASHGTAGGSPCILVRACDPGRPFEKWQMHGISLLDPGQWDMRMIYSMAG